MATLSEAMKLALAKSIAKEHGYYIVQMIEKNIPRLLLYREVKGARGVFVGKRSNATTMLVLVKSATGHV